MSRSDEFVPLSERVGMLMAFRVLGAGSAVALELTLVPGANLVDQLGIVAAYLAVTGLLSAPVRTGHRSLTLLAFGIALLADGLFLQGERVLGDPVGMDVLIAAYLAAVVLLASFRTGVKVALWHSLLMLLAHQAAVRGELGSAADPLRDQTATLAYLAVLWLAVLTTASFAAVNERELRRRRYDSEALRRFAVGLTTAERRTEVHQRLLDFCHEELGAVRGAVITLTPGGRVLSVGQGLSPHVDVAVGTVRDFADSPSDFLRTSGSEESARIIYRLGAGEPWLAAVFPAARRLVSLRLTGHDDEGWLVLELGGKGSRLERRVIGTAAHACGAAVLASSRTTLLEKLRSAAATDGLTGVANRRTFDEAMGRFIAAGDRAAAALLIIDVDHFKSVNDRYGHESGDLVLQSVAAILSSSARAEDMVARYGGEEFVVLLPRTTVGQAAATAERIRQAIEAGSGPVRVTASIGVSWTGPAAAGGNSAATLVSRADAALYTAKNGGRNQVVTEPTGRLLHVAPPAASVRDHRG